MSARGSWLSYPSASRRNGRSQKWQTGDRVSRRLLWSLLLGVAVSLAILIASRDEDAITKLLRHDVSDVVLKAAIAIFVGGLLLVIFRERITKALEAALFWTVIGLLLAVGYAYRGELQEAGDRVLAELIPGRAATHGHVVEIVRGKGGDFSIHTNVNGAKIAMLLDTGASSVILTQEAAKAAGLPIDMLTYTVDVDTANGRTHAAPVTLDRLAVGGLTEREVPALVVQAGGLKSNLLGMTFLNRLESWEVRGDKLRLRGTP
jgi:aspartyl protease family protein